jgi:hypothetical protein
MLIQRDGWKILHNIAQEQTCPVSKSAGTATLASTTSLHWSKKL